MGLGAAFYWADAIAIPGFVAWAYFVMATEPHDFRLARVLFSLSALGIVAFAVVWDMTARQSNIIRYLVVSLLGVVAVVGLAESLRLVARREKWVADHHVTPSRPRAGISQRARAIVTPGPLPPHPTSLVVAEESGGAIEPKVTVHDYPPKFPRTYVQPSIAVPEAKRPLMIDCRSGFMPTSTLGQDDRIFVMNVFPSKLNTSGLYEMFNINNGPQRLIEEGKLPPEAWICQITNYGSTPLLNVDIMIHIHWHTVRREGNSTHIDQPHFETDYKITATRIELTQPNGFRFYITNNSDEYAEISFPSTVTGTELDTGKQVTLELRSTQPTLRSWPRPKA